MRFALSPNERLIRHLVRLLDRDEYTAAETWRLVGAAAERLGLVRPSYGHVRRLVRLERTLRLLRMKRRGVLGLAAARAAAGLAPNVPGVIDDLAELRSREELVIQDHKPP